MGVDDPVKAALDAQERLRQSQVQMDIAKNLAQIAEELKQIKEVLRGLDSAIRQSAALRH